MENRIGNLKQKAVFLDRNGTINEDCGYVHKIEHFKFIPNALEAMKLLSQTDYKLIIITGQSGIGRGYYTKKDYEDLTQYMLNELTKEDVRIDSIYYCPHSPEENCPCRKPKTGLLKKAEEDFNLELRACYVIGDKADDIRMGKSLNCKTILVATGKGTKEKGKAGEDYFATDLLEAAKIIVGSS